ncbi:hypothetical protein BDZ91DRAFT_730605 [Kalaharituber pfeilii]|nr:hypothetical protein BDZ91DRAFT_730605 [Kalaharituber pfeilii]
MPHRCLLPMLFISPVEHITVNIYLMLYYLSAYLIAPPPLHYAHSHSQLELHFPTSPIIPHDC